MNKFIKEFPQENFKFRLYDNPAKKTWQQIKKETNCYALINCGYFSLKTFSTDSAFMVGQKWTCPSIYHEFGLLIDEEGRMTVGTEKEAVFDYCVGLPPVYIGGNQYVPNLVVGKNGNTMVGIKPNGNPVFLICGKDLGQTEREGVSDLLNWGCTDIFRFDGSWSTQGSLGDGMDLQPSQKRIARNYILVYKKHQGETNMTNKKVFVSPSTQEHNGNGKYGYIEETEMNLIADIVVPELNRHGVATERNKPEDDLRAIVAKSNKYSPDLHLAIHSNAHGGNTPPEKRTCRGAVMCIYKKNGKAHDYANALLSEFDKIQPFSNRGAGKIYVNPGFYEVKRTGAPAVIAEVDFHDNNGATWVQMNRKRIAEALVRGTLTCLGIKYIPVADDTTETKPPVTETPWYAEAKTWAVQNNIADGTRPEETATRAEIWQMLYNYKKNI